MLCTLSGEDRVECDEYTLRPSFSEVEECRKAIRGSRQMFFAGAGEWANTRHMPNTFKVECLLKMVEG